MFLVFLLACVTPRMIVAFQMFVLKRLEMFLVDTVLIHLIVYIQDPRLQTLELLLRLLSLHRIKRVDSDDQYFSYVLSDNPMRCYELAAFQSELLKIE